MVKLYELLLDYLFLLGGNSPAARRTGAIIAGVVWHSDESNTGQYGGESAFSSSVSSSV